MMPMLQIRGCWVVANWKLKHFSSQVGESHKQAGELQSRINSQNGLGIKKGTTNDAIFSLFPSFRRGSNSCLCELIRTLQFSWHKQDRKILRKRIPLFFFEKLALTENW